MSARLLLAVVLLLVTGVARADYKQDYLNGVDAAKQGDWAEVRRLMRAAIAQEGAPAAKKRLYGNIMSPYVPHYYLGLANARLGDCAGALSAFKAPGSESVVAGLGDLATQQRAAIIKCDQQALAANTDKPAVPPIATKPPVSDAAVSTAPVAATRPSVVSTAAVTPPVKAVTPPVSALPAARVASVNAALARAAIQITGLDGKLRAPPMKGTGDAKAKSANLEALRQQRQQAASALAAAQSAAELTRIEAQARKLESDLATLGQRIDSASAGLALAEQARVLDGLRARATAALTTLDQTIAQASAAGLPAAATSAASATRSALQQAVTASDRAIIERALNATSGATTLLAKAIAAAPKSAPEQLRALVGWYLAADYAQVDKWDGVAALPDAKARAQAYLVRAAARLHLYVRGGEEDASLNAAVDTDLRNAKRLDAKLKPNAQVFSPRLVERFAGL